LLPTQRRDCKIEYSDFTSELPRRASGRSILYLPLANKIGDSYLSSPSITLGVEPPRCGLLPRRSKALVARRRGCTWQVFSSRYRYRYQLWAFTPPLFTLTSFMYLSFRLRSMTIGGIVSVAPPTHYLFNNEVGAPIFGKAETSEYLVPSA